MNSTFWRFLLMVAIVCAFAVQLTAAGVAQVVNDESDPEEAKWAGVAAARRKMY